MPFTVLSAEFAHETNTFSIVPTTWDLFHARSRCLEGDEAIAARGHANTEIGGFLKAANEHGWKLIHVLSASANPGGKVTDDAFERLGGAIVEAARKHRGAIDGIALGLHGAMVTASSEDGEGELLERLRAVVGPDLPIAVTLDLHANVTRRMCALAQIIVSYRTYPHVDMRRTGRQAADILQRAMAGEIRPRTLRAHRPMLGETSGGRTDRGPMLDWLARSRAYEAAQAADVFAVSLNAGFSHADIAEVGPTVLVTCQGDVAAHQAFAESIADSMWELRFEESNHYLKVDAAAARARAWPDGAKPLVIADYADNPGGGAYGDATALLGAMLEAGVREACFGPIIDPGVAHSLQAHAVGDTVSVQLGGKTDPRFGGGPLALTGRLQWKGMGDYTGSGPMIGGQRRSWGETAVLRVEGVDVLIVTNPAQIWDLEQFRAFGIDPTVLRVVALKSAQHFRAAFEPIAGEVIVCDSGALCAPDCSVLPYQKVPRPIFPLDPQMVFSRPSAPAV